MQRREALKLLAGAAALPLLSRDAFALFQTVHEQLSGTAALKTLDPHQNATVTTIVDLIIPATETPGAKAVRVNEFIDVILTDWYDDSDKSAFFAGLVDVDIRSRNLFGKDFVDSNVQQQTQILTDLDDELMRMREFHDPKHPPGRPPEKHFFHMIKQLTLTGYYTSQVGFEQELHQYIIPPRHAGCVSIEEEAGT